MISNQALLILFFLGAAFGSFFNVLIYRFKPEKGFFHLPSIKGRSHCPYCKKKLSWFELIPLFSYLIQLGKCRNCHHKLPFRYFFVEFITALIFVCVPLFIFNFYKVGLLSISPFIFYILSGLWVLVFSVFVLMAFIDKDHYIIPNGLNLFLFFIGILIVYVKTNINDLILPFHESFLGHYLLVFSSTQNIILNHVIGAVAGAGLFMFLIFITKGKAVGWGDVKLGFAAGVVLGWPDIALALMLAFIIGGFFGGYLLFKKKKKMKDRLPFAPFIIIGCGLSIFWGYQIVHGYFEMLGV